MLVMSILIKGSRVVGWILISVCVLALLVGLVPAEYIYVIIFWGIELVTGSHLSLKVVPSSGVPLWPWLIGGAGLLLLGISQVLNRFREGRINP